MKKKTYLLSMLMTCLCTTMLIAQPDHAATRKVENGSFKKEREYERELKKANARYYREMTKANRAYHREMRKADAKIYREMAKNGQLAVKKYLKARKEALKEGRPLPPPPACQSISISQKEYLKEYDQFVKANIVSR